MPDHPPRELVVMRHAKSDWHSGAASDFERPLNKRGSNDAPRMGRWLKNERLVPDHLVSSEAERARLTTLAVANEARIKEAKIHWDRRVYMADVPTLLEVLADCPSSAHRVMLVGHNPGLEDLVEFLAAPDRRPPLPLGFLKTATVAQLQVPDAWGRLKQGSATLVRVVTPRSLPATP